MCKTFYINVMQIKGYIHCCELGALKLMFLEQRRCLRNLKASFTSMSSSFKRHLALVFEGKMPDVLATKALPLVLRGIFCNSVPLYKFPEVICL